MDETGFSTVPSRMGKIISLKGGGPDLSNGSLITLTFAINAVGNSLPSFYLFQGKK